MSTLDEKLIVLSHKGPNELATYRVHYSLFVEIKEEIDRLRTAVDRLLTPDVDGIGEPYSACLCDEGHGVCYKIWHNGGRIHFQPAILEWNHARLMEALDKQDGRDESDSG